MIQLSGGIALAGMAGCLGSSDEKPANEEASGDDTNGDESSNDADGNANDQGNEDASPKTGDDAPDSEVETPDGETVTLTDDGKPTAVLFTDIASAEARAHSEELARLYEEHEEEIRLVTVNTDLDASESDLRKFREEYGGDWAHAMGTDEVLEEYGVDAQTALCVINSEGELAARFDGEMNPSEIEAALKAKLEERKGDDGGPGGNPGH